MKQQPVSPLTRMKATFLVMQGWWGEVNLDMKSQEDTVVFYRYCEPGNGTQMSVQFNITDKDGTRVEFSMPVNLFSKVEHTDYEGNMEVPTALIFHFTDEGYDEFCKKLPGIVEFWTPVLAIHNRALVQSICFVMDPSVFEMFENDQLLYSPTFLEGMRTFKFHYNEQWENHLYENGMLEGEYEDSIVPIGEKDFEAYSKGNGLRNADSKITVPFRKKTLRVFVQRRNVERKKKSSKRRPRKINSAGTVEEEDEGDDSMEHRDDGEEMEVDGDDGEQTDAKKQSFKKPRVTKIQTFPRAPIPAKELKALQEATDFVAPALPKRRRK